MNIKETCLATILLLIAVAAQCDPEIVVSEITIGAVYNLSGEQASLDLPSVRGAQLAVKQINQQGGLLGKPLHLVLIDGKSNAQEIRDKTESLLQQYPTLTAVLGLSDTDMVLAAAPPVAAMHKVFLTSGATSPKLPRQVPDYLFLACFGDNVQAAAGAQWAWDELGARSVAVLFDRDYEYTRLLQTYFRRSFKRLGGRVSALRSYDAEHIEHTIKLLPPVDLIYIAAEPPAMAVKLATALRDAGYDAPIMGGDGFDDAKVWQAAPGLSDIYYTTHAYMGKDNLDPNVAVFRKLYLNEYPGETVSDFAALGYDSVNLLVAAIEQAQSGDPEKVRDALQNIDEFQGVTGQISYPDGVKVPKKTVSIIKISQAQKTLVGEVLPDWIASP